MMDGALEPGSDLRWWRYEGDALTSNLSQTIQQLYSRQWYRREADWRHARMYGNYVGAGTSGAPSLRASQFTFGSYRLALNVVKNMCGAATAKITKNRPKPMFLTSGGDYAEQKKAKQLTKFAEGQFYESNLYSLAPTVMLDACIYGTGIMKIFAEQEAIKCERIFPWEVLVDEADGRDMTPRQLYQVQRMDKLVLCELYPDHAEKIMVCPMIAAYDYESADSSLMGYLSNLIQVREAWHLPSGKDATDGKHVITIENDVLLEEDYKKDYFPFSLIRWSKAPVGYWGIGLTEELTGIQLEINTLLRSIQLAHNLMGKSHWMVENSSKVLSTYLDNEIGSIIKYTGIAPQVYVPQSVSPEIYQHLWQLYAKSYEIAGISQLSAQSQKPAGLDSGKALRIFSDIQTERFVVVAREYESFFVETSRQMIELAREISEENPKYSVRVDGPRSFERINWKDIHLTEDEYVLKAFPVSALSDDPASRMQQVQEMMQNELISQEDGLRLLDFPDLEQSFKGRFASHELIEDLIERMVDKGEYQSPEPLMDLDDAIKTTQMAYLRGKVDKVPQKALDLLLRFLSDCIALKAPPPQAGPPAPMPQDMGMMPPEMGAGPMPPPMLPPPPPPPMVA